MKNIYKPLTKAGFFLNRAEIPQNSNYCDQPGMTQGISHLLKFRLCDKTNKFNETCSVQSTYLEVKLIVKVYITML